MKHILVSFLLMASLLAAPAQTRIANLRVQHADQPLAIEDRHPVFSWRMESVQRGARQTAYRIEVKREGDGSLLWDTGKVADSRSDGIAYRGVALQPETAYGVKVTVWDQNNAENALETRFETGMMNPRQSAWKGADWIGTHELTLDAASQSIFDLRTDVQIVRGGEAALILGADDVRLKNAS